MGKLGKGALITVLAILILGGVIAGVKQVQGGLATTSLHEPVVWGLYVVCFVYFAGAGAGALMITSLALSSASEKYRLVARAGAVVSLVSMALSGLFITIDLGRPDRVYLLLLKAQLRSPLIWDFIIINVMLGLAALYTFFVLRAGILGSPRPHGRLARLLAVGGKTNQINQIPKPLRFLAAAAVVCLPILYVLTTRVFATLRARPDWNVTSLGAVFLISALLSGLAAIYVVVSLSRQDRKQMNSTGNLWRGICNGLILLIVIDMVISFSPLASMRQFGSPSRQIAWTGISGFGLLELLGGMLLPAVLLLVIRSRPRFWSAAAGVLILLGVFVKRWHIVIPAMLRRNLPLPEASYHPSLVEYAVSVGIAALGILGIYLLMNFAKVSAAPNLKSDGFA